MRSVDKPARYGGVARSLHWAVAGAIALQFLLSQLAEMAEHDGERLRQLALLANHKSVGITILAVALLRLAWRLASPPPALPSAVPVWQQRAASVTHWALYGVLFAMPLTGWLMSSASAYSVSWFGVFTIPDLIGPDADLKDVFEELHEGLAKILIVVVAVHFLAALKHHFVDRDDVLRRMSSIPTVALLFVVFAAGGLLLTTTTSRAPAGTTDQPAAPRPASDARPETEAETGPESQRVPDAIVDGDGGTRSQPGAQPESQDATGRTPDAAAVPPAQPTADSAPKLRTRPESQSGPDQTRRVPASAAEPSADAQPASTEAPAPGVAVEAPSAAKPEPAAAPQATPWAIDYADSFIRFTAEQAGANFTGAWTDWSANMRFADTALADSRFVVEVRVAGVDTRDEERDQTLMDAEWFAADAYPQVTFRTLAVRRREDGGYAADATLDAKGERHPIVFEFEVAADGARRTLTGRARLDRLALGIGTGEWENTEWIGRYVDVDVRVLASVP